MLLRPTADDPNKITKVKIINSTLFELTPELCETFPNLAKIEFVQTEINSINPKAFIRCQELESLKFIKTHIKMGLYGQLLDQNIYLRELVLDGIGLTYFDCALLLHLEQLETLVVASNKLKYIAFHQMPQLEHLKYLVLSGNGLLDFDEYEILRKFPSLTNIDISHNYLECRRVKAMLGAFKTRDVYVGKMWRTDHVSFLLGIDQNKEGDVECSDFIKNEFQKEKLEYLKEEIRWNRHLIYNTSIKIDDVRGNESSLRMMIYSLYGLLVISSCVFLIGLFWIHRQLKNKILIEELEANSRTVASYAK